MIVLQLISVYSCYNYRLGNVETEHFDPSRVEDSRLGVLCKEWFAGKNGLDIGCNSGEFTITFGKLVAWWYSCHMTRNLA